MAESTVGDGCPSQDVAISIQSDWQDVIFTRDRHVWISCTCPGRESIHEKLKSGGLNLPSSTSSHLSVISLTRLVMQVRFNPSGQVYSFVAPAKTFSNIHGKNILSLHVSDKRLGVSVCTDDKLLVWNATTGQILQTLSGHLANVYKCRFFPSGIVVLSGGADMQLKIWSAETGICPVTLTGHTGPVTDFCIVDRGRNIVSVSKDGTSKLWDCGRSECLATVFDSKNTLNCCAIGTLPQEVEAVREEQSSSSNSREIGTRNKLLVIGSEEGFVYGIAIFHRKKIFSVNVSSPVNLILILSDNMVVGCQNGQIKIFKFSHIKVPSHIYGDSNSPVLCGCLFKDSGFFIGRNDGTVTYYDFLHRDKDKVTLTGSDLDPIYDMCYNSHNNKIYTCCRDGKIRQYVMDSII